MINFFKNLFKKPATNNKAQDTSESSGPLFGSEQNSPLILERSQPVEDFHPAANDPCFCNSGKTFGDCCGSTSRYRAPPFGVNIFEDYVDKKILKELRAFADEREGQPLTVIDNINSTPENVVKVRDERRVAERVFLGDYRQKINKLVKTIYTDLADMYYGQELDWFEAPDLMRYRPGGFYIRHADSQNMDVTTKLWTRVIDRDLSLLVYLNEDFEGGALTFTKFNYQIQPKAGTVVIFPSDHRYLHQAEKVTDGIRYALVSWSAVKGSTRISSRPPESAIRVDEPGCAGVS